MGPMGPMGTRKGQKGDTSFGRVLLCFLACPDLFTNLLSK